jgi:hypothetical protein
VKFSLSVLEVLVDSDYCEHRPDQFVRAWLYCALVKYGWAPLASFQGPVSDMESDFWGWGIANFEEGQRDFGSIAFRKMFSLLG